MTAASSWMITLLIKLGDARLREKGTYLTSPIVGWKSIAWLEALPFRRGALRVPGAKAFNG
jgi:hypothetical protein